MNYEETEKLTDLDLLDAGDFEEVPDEMSDLLKALEAPTLPSLPVLEEQPKDLNEILETGIDDHHKAHEQFKKSNYTSTTMEDTLTFPFLEIAGVQFEPELKYISIRDEGEDVMPLLIRIEDGFVEVGTMRLTLENILTIMSVKEYQLILHESREESKDVTSDLLDTLMLT